MSPRVGGGSVFPAQGELVVVFVDVARQRHQVDVDLLQVVGAAGLLLDGRAAARQAVGRVRVRRWGALIWTRPGECTTWAAGLSATMASITGRDSSLCWKAMNTLDMGFPCGQGSEREAGLLAAGLELVHRLAQRGGALGVQGQFGHRCQRGLGAVRPL